MRKVKLAMSCVNKKFNIIDNDIHDIKEGELIGLFIDKSAISGIFPNITIKNHSGIEYNMDIDFDYGSVKLCNSVFNDFIPLIFTKTEDNKAQELLSGQIFVLDDETSLRKNIETKENVKSFDTFIKKYKNNNVIISSYNADLETEEDIKYCFCQVDSNFKKIYQEKTIPIKDDVIFELTELKNDAVKKFNYEYNNQMNDIHMYALRENKKLSLKLQNKSRD